MVARYTRFRSELVGEALGVVWAALRVSDVCFDSSGRARAWCRTVLTNRLRDLLRGESGRQIQFPRTRNGDASDTGGIVADPRGTNALNERLAELDLRAEFCLEDVHAIGRWSPMCRVYILSLAGLWLKVPTETWSQWLQEAGFPDGYPPPELEECDDRHQRSHLLAEFAGHPVNRLQKVWSEYHRLLLA